MSVGYWVAAMVALKVVGLVVYWVEQKAVLMAVCWVEQKVDWMAY